MRGSRVVRISLGRHAAATRAGEAALGDPRQAAAISAPLAGIEGRELASIAIRRRIVLLGDVTDGALMKYVMDYADADRRIAHIIDKILHGTPPGEIPFEQPDRSWFAVNRTTAKAIGVVLPKELLLRANEIVD